MDNKRTRIKPGRYLEKYFGPLLAKYGVSVKSYSADFARRYEPRKLLFAVTEDEIQWVYEHGPDSCMSNAKYRERHGWGYGHPGYWPLDMHACRVYAAGDLQVGYLTDNDEPKGHVVARSLIWPAKKTYSRCYGDEIRMRTALMANGYTFAPPIGAKVKRIKVDSTFVLPYIDIGDRSGTGAMAARDKKDHFILCAPVPGTYAANSTSGAAGKKYGRDMRPMEMVATECAHCGAHVDDVGELWRVYTGHNPNDYRHLCEGCRDDRTYYCEVTDRYYSNEIPRVEMYNGEFWSEIAFRQHGFRCVGSGLRYPNGMCQQLADGTLWSEDYARDHGFVCEYTGDMYQNVERVDLADGHVVCRSVLHDHGFVCTSCNRNFMNSARRGTQCVSCIETEANAAVAAGTLTADGEITL